MQKDCRQKVRVLTQILAKRVLSKTIENAYLPLVSSCIRIFFRWKLLQVKWCPLNLFLFSTSENGLASWISLILCGILIALWIKHKNEFYDSSNYYVGGMQWEAYWGNVTSIIFTFMRAITEQSRYAHRKISSVNQLQKYVFYLACNYCMGEK